MQKTCIIIPCYNEENRLNFKKFLQFISENEHHFYFVNDGSTDFTINLINKLYMAHPEKVKIFNIKYNQGKAEAVRHGILAAANKAEYNFIGYFDADLATPLEEIDFLVNYLTQGYEVVIGSRVKRLGAKITRSPLRHYLGRVFATVASIHLGIKVYDSQCGAKIFSSGITQTLFKEPFSSKWLFDLELIYRLKEMRPESFNLDILEIPLRTWKEQQNSKMKFLDFLKAPFELFKIKKIK